jgi:5-hydroxyisourate hydrolase-like protein (transthyretin family)
MFRRPFVHLTLVLAFMALAVPSLSAQKEDTHKARKFTVPPPSARIEVTVVRDASGKPVENAAVVFHPIEGDHDKGVMELKTNEEGKTVIDVIPVGDTVRMQIIARGFQTTGEDFKVDKEEIKLVVRLRRPGQQYSIYRPGQSTSGTQSGQAPAAAQPAPKSGEQTGTDKAQPPSK